LGHSLPLMRKILALAVLCLPASALAGDSGGWDGDGPVLEFHGLELEPDIKFYVNYTINLSEDDGDAIGTDNKFSIGRAYLGLKLKIADWISARVTYDASQASDIGKSGELDEDGEVESSKFQGSMLARMKYAYVSLKIKAIDAQVRFGMAHTPYIDWVEHIEDTRYMGKIMIETEYGYPSADFGLMLIGQITDYFNYHIGVYNGEGYHGIEDDPFKDIITRLTLRPAPAVKGLQALQFSLYGRIQLSAPDHANTNRQYGGAITYRLVDAVKTRDCAKVEGEKLALWFQIFTGEQSKQDGAGNWHIPRSLGWSAGGRFELPADLFLIARLDGFDPDLDTDDDNTFRPLGAFGIRLWKGLHVSLTYKGKIHQDIDNHDDEHLLGVFSEFRL